MLSTGFERKVSATVRVADPAFNAERTIELMEKAALEKAILVLFPELGLSAYSCEDLFHQQALLDGALDAVHVLDQMDALDRQSALVYERIE